MSDIQDNTDTTTPLALPETDTPLALPEGFTPHVPSTRQAKSVLSMVGSVYHRTPNAQPQGSDIRFMRLLDTQEQAFGPRRIKLTEKWQTLDSGWVENCCFLLISNLEGRFLSNVPTEEERVAISQRVIEVTFVPDSVTSIPEKKSNRTMYSEPKIDPILPILRADIFIPPGEDLPITPSDVSRIRIRCRNGEAYCYVTFFPGK